VNLKSVTILHVKRIWAIGRLYATAIEQKPDRVGSLALSLTEGIHQFLEGSCTLDLKEYLIVVVRNFDVEMLSLSTFGLIGGGASVVVVAGHVVGNELNV